MIEVYITCKDEEEAVNISKHLLNKRLVACTNIFPIRSMYWWKKEIVDENEYVILVKSIEKHFETIKKEVKEIHSYDIPCIVKMDSEANKEYVNWVEEETDQKKISKA